MLVSTNFDPFGDIEEFSTIQILVAVDNSTYFLPHYPQ